MAAVGVDLKLVVPATNSRLPKAAARHYNEAQASAQLGCSSG
jgi:hypothetical protein